MKKRQHVLYDFDGVIADTLAAHIKFWRDLNDEFGFGMSIPKSNRGNSFGKFVNVPMDAFLINIGIPEDHVKDVENNYDENFGGNKRYSFKLFDGIADMVKRFGDKGYVQKVVTFNHSNNVLPILKREGLADYFSGIITKEDLKKDFNCDKAMAIRRECYVEEDVVPIEDTIYVGDMESDYRAAQDVGTKFIGTSYGWGFDAKEGRFPVAHNVNDLTRLIRSR
jgi:phosphoglycolate phosphatase-like HAD superfamily hydrolase